MRRRVVVAASLAVAPLAIVAACSFPDVTFAPPGGTSGGSEGGPGSETGTTGEGGPDDSGNPALSDVITTRGDEQGIIKDDAACKDAAPCDCDNDGYLAKDCDAGRDAGKEGGDCDDLDPLAHPHQDYVSEAPTTTTNGDWNCDGTVEKGIPDKTNPSWCVYSLQTVSCSTGGPGFNGETPCGVSANLYNCVTTGALQCGLTLDTTANPSQRPQACR